MIHAPRAGHRPRALLLYALLSLAILCAPSSCLLLLLTPVEALAQEGDEEKRWQIVILDVPFEGTQTVAQAIVDKREDITVYPQSWFIERIDEVGFDADGIIKRRNQLAIVMEEAEIDYILLTQYSEKREAFRFTLVPREEDAETFSFDIEAFKEDGMARGTAIMMSRELFAFLDEQRGGEPAEASDARQSAEGDAGEAPLDANALREAAIKEQEQKKSAEPKGAAIITGGFRLIEPTLIVIAASSEVVNSLAITLGPAVGFGFAAELFPLRFSGEPADAPGEFGVSLDYSQVFKSLSLTPEPTGGLMPGSVPQEPAPTRLSYLDLSIAAFYSFSIGQERAPRAHLRPKAFLQIQRLGANQEVLEFDDFRFLSIGLGADVVFPIASSPASLLVSAQVAPLTSLNTVPLVDLGTFSYAYSTGGSLGLSYDFLPNVGARIQYIFDHSRLSFEEKPIDIAEPAVTTTPKGTFSAAGVFAGVSYVY